MGIWDVNKIVRINKPPQIVWNILKQVQGWPRWDVDLKEVILPEPIDPNQSLEGKKGVRKLFNVIYI